MSKSSTTLRVSNETYEALRQKATAQGVSITALANQIFNDKDPEEINNAVMTGINSSSQPLQVTLVDRRQDARIDAVEEQAKHTAAFAISTRLGLYQLAKKLGEDIDTMNSYMAGAYNRLIEGGYVDIANEVKRLNKAASDGDLDEDELEYYINDEDDEDDNE